MISRDMSEAISLERVHNKSGAECTSVDEDRALIDLQAQESTTMLLIHTVCVCVCTLSQLLDYIFGFPVGYIAMRFS